ncbi:DUF4349 domain-containing protein [Nonomuraea sp. NPDC050536]|uniref:DUF4349 domain-containing protein n=1 Tax=Nonomuraea sp. NPDC050536 TaxID=3364366 RepID=UPI0037C5A4C1
MRTIRYGTALALALGVALLSGCGGGGAVTTQSQSDAAPMYRGEAAPTPAPADQKAAEGGTGKSLTAGVTVTQQDRQVIYVGGLTVRAKDVPTAADRAKQIVTAAGGYLSKEDSSAASDAQANATLEFKVPPARYPDVLASLGRDLGKRVSVNQGTQDVTMQVADVDSRLKSAQRTLDSLRTLLTKAKTIGQVLEVEREISTREADLESLQAQQKELARQVSMATLTLQLIGPAAVAHEPSHEPSGFLGGLKTGWNALVSFVKIVLTVLGVLLPWLIVALPVVLVVVFLVRRGRPRTPPPPAEAPEPTT